MMDGWYFLCKYDQWRRNKQRNVTCTDGTTEAFTKSQYIILFNALANPVEIPRSFIDPSAVFRAALSAY